ncbi:MAG: stage II sporulation protein M [Clostridium butyricum]
MNISGKKVNIGFNSRKGYFFIVLIMFCLGLSFGLYTVKYMGPADKNDLINYFTSFANSLGNDQINYGSLLVEVVKKNVIIILPIFLVGLTFFGGPVILIIDLLKGFILGYTFSFMATVFQGKGFELAMISIIPQNLIYIPCIIGLSIIGLSMSTESFKRRFFKKNKGDSLFSEGIVKKLAVIAVLFIAGILVETYISPMLIKFVVTKFYL